MNRVYIGLDIGGTKILGALFDEHHNVIKKVKKKTKAIKGSDFVVKQIDKVIEELMADEMLELIGIGAGAPGIIVRQSIIEFCPNIPFEQYNLGKRMEEKYHVPFVLGNDVNVAMYGEWKAAEDRRLRNIIGIFVGTGIGGALILDGELYTGQGGAGEIGHMIVNPGGVICGCGSHGCVEAYASKTGMQRAINAGLRKGHSSMLSQYLEEDGSVIKSSSLTRAYEAKDGLALDVIDNAMSYLGIAVANLINIFHPDMIILGGGVMESLGEHLMPMIKAEASKHTMPGMMDHLRFKLSDLSDDAGIYGAYQLILNHINE